MSKSVFSKNRFVWADAYEKIRSCLMGEDALKDAGDLYLIPPSGMEGNSRDQVSRRDRYRKRASYIGTPAEALDAQLGMLFREDPKIEVPGALEAVIKKMRSRGEPIESLIQRMAHELLTMGWCGLLVDMSNAASSGASAVPYFSVYKAEDILEWEQADDGELRTIRVKVRDSGKNIDDGGNVDRHVEMKLVDGRYEVQVWSGEKLAESMEPVSFDRSLDFVPFVFCNTKSLKAEPSCPPMLTLCNLTLDHFRMTADHRHELHQAAMIQRWVSGVDKSWKPEAGGAGSLWTFTSPETKVGITETSGAGLGARREELDKVESSIQRASGLPTNYTGKRTAEEIRVSMATATARLNLVASTIEMAIEKAFVHAARIMRIEMVSDDDISVKINRDFVKIARDPQDLVSLVKAWQSGIFGEGETGHRNALKTAEQWGLVPPGLDEDEAVASFAANESVMPLERANTGELGVRKEVVSADERAA